MRRSHRPSETNRSFEGADRGLEAENVAPKKRVLSGEVNARSRPQNSLIEEDLDLERVMKPIPIVTEEVVQELEETIKSRVLSGICDEVHWTRSSSFHRNSSISKIRNLPSPEWRSASTSAPSPRTAASQGKIGPVREERARGVSVHTTTNRRSPASFVASQCSQSSWNDLDETFFLGKTRVTARVQSLESHQLDSPWKTRLHEGDLGNSAGVLAVVLTLLCFRSMHGSCFFCEHVCSCP